MKQFIIIDAAGKIVRSGTVTNDTDLALQQVPDGYSVVGDATGRPGKDRWTGTAVEPLPVATPTLAEIKTATLAHLARRRWQVESGGILIGGRRIATDDRAKLLITDAARCAEADPTFSTKWKSRDGWVTVNATALVAMRNAVFTHVAACFAREAELSGLVTAASDVASLASLRPAIASFWPE